MFTHHAEEDALGGRKTREFQTVQSAGESPREELQVFRETHTTEHSRLQQTKYRAGNFGRRTAGQQPR